jgi:hypothetical protein
MDTPFVRVETLGRLSIDGVSSVELCAHAS